MKNGPGQARGQRSPVLLARKSGQGRNARSRVMTGLLGPGPRGMAVCHAVARLTYDYKNPLPLSQVRAGGRVSPVSGEGGTFGRRAGGPPSPRPLSSSQCAFFRKMGRRCGATGYARLKGPPVQWESGGGRKKCGQGPEDSRAVGKRHGEMARRKGRAWSAGTLLLAYGRASEGGEGTVRLLVCSLRREESMRGRDVSPPGPSRYDGGRHGQAAVAPSPSCQNGMSSRSIPGRWPCP